MVQRVEHGLNTDFGFRLQMTIIKHCYEVWRHEMYTMCIQLYKYENKYFLHIWRFFCDDKKIQREKIRSVSALLDLNTVLNRHIHTGLHFG